MATLYTSDTHFNHARIREYCPATRGHFSDLEAMNRDIIAKWNARVGDDDVVYHLGDFALGQYTLADPIFSELNGKEKHLILGNHDRAPARMLAMGWTTVEIEGELTLPDGRRIHLAHHPLPETKLTDMGVTFQLCGHVHQKWDRARTFIDTAPGNEHDRFVRGVRDPNGRVINVGVDVRQLQPVTLEELLGNSI